jgi:hypothetical protein
MQNKNKNRDISGGPNDGINSSPRSGQGKSRSVAAKPLTASGVFNMDKPEKNNASSSAALFLGRANATKHATASIITSTIRTNTSAPRLI